MRLLRTNSSKTTFGESLLKFRQRLGTQGYPKTVMEGSLSGVIFASRPKANERILPFATTNNPVASNLKQKLMEQWTRVQNQSLLKTNHLKLTSDYIKEVYLLGMC